MQDFFICSITCEIMKDPVSTMDGFTYERAAITKWFEDHDTSPLTGLHLQSKSLIPNIALRCAIQEYKKKHVNEEEEYNIEEETEKPRLLNSVLKRKIPAKFSQLDSDDNDNDCNFTYISNVKIFDKIEFYQYKNIY